MTTETNLQSRSGATCELCGAVDGLGVYQVAPHTDATPETCLLACNTCSSQIDAPKEIDVNHWRCLNDSMWSQEPPVQVIAWRMLTRLSAEDWARKLLEMLYLEEGILAWAKAEGSTSSDDNSTVEHKDSNGARLAAGDTVTLIKDLNVKGAGFTAKRGTAVRNISLVHDNAAHIEGRVNWQQIVILTEFVKKSG
jgi:protein PhnA